MLRSATTLAQAEQQGIKAGKSIDELRSLPAGELLQKSLGFLSPIVDGYVLPQSIADIFAAGKNNQVSLLTGWNQDEGFLFGPTAKAEEYVKQTRAKYGDRADNLLKYYPAEGEEQAAASQRDLSRDMVFGVQNYTWAKVQSDQGKSAVYVYRFTRRMPAIGDTAKYGAFHTAEVPYAYNNLRAVRRPFVKSDEQLADLMSTYWANFARTGNPSARPPRCRRR